MTGYFLIGFLAGIVLATVFIVSKLYLYKREANLAQKNVDRLEKFNSDLQFELKKIGRKADALPRFSL